MNAMEIMLQAFVRNCPISSVGEELQNILQVWHLQRVGFPGAVPQLGGVTNVHAAVDGPPLVLGLSILQAGAHLLWGSPPSSSGSLASPGCGQRPFPL